MTASHFAQRTRDLVWTGLGAGAVLALGLCTAFLVATADTSPRTPTLPGGGAGIQVSSLYPPVDGMDARAFGDGFWASRPGGRPHLALDIAAPRHTPVRAASGGVIARLASGGPGGIAVFQTDSSRRLGYYYAHLLAYAPGLAEGVAVRRGQLLGYVGSTGNATEDAPHLHFAVYRLARGGWETAVPIDPSPLLRAVRN